MIDWRWCFVCFSVDEAHRLAREVELCGGTARVQANKCMSTLASDRLGLYYAWLCAKNRVSVRPRVFEHTRRSPQEASELALKAQETGLGSVVLDGCTVRTSVPPECLD